MNKPEIHLWVDLKWKWKNKTHDIHVHLMSHGIPEHHYIFVFVECTVYSDI